MANGDTVHPASVERTVLAARGDDDLVIAVDAAKPLAQEEMKVQLSSAGHLTRITKQMDPAQAAGEYIGVTLIEPHAATALADALQATFERDPQLYYEDGFQELADRGGKVLGAPIGDVAWVEVDDHADLARAREIACLC
jgi:choline kinase